MRFQKMWVFSLPRMAREITGFAQDVYWVVGIAKDYYWAPRRRSVPELELATNFRLQPREEPEEWEEKENEVPMKPIPMSLAGEVLIPLDIKYEEIEPKNRCVSRRSNSNLRIKKSKSKNSRFKFHDYEPPG